MRGEVNAARIWECEVSGEALPTGGDATVRARSLRRGVERFKVNLRSVRRRAFEREMQDQGERVEAETATISCPEHVSMRSVAHAFWVCAMSSCRDGVSRE